MDVSLTSPARGLLIASALLSAVAAGQVRTDSPDKREVEELIAKYLAGDSTDIDRARALQRLREATPSLAAAPLRVAIRRDDTRSVALMLATDLCVEGLWATAKLYIDGEDEDVVSNYGVALQERGAASQVFERWKSADFSSATYWIAAGALRKHPIDVLTVREVKQYLDAADEGDEKVSDALAILRHQLALPRATVDEIKAKWGELISDLSVNARRFRVLGADLSRVCRTNRSGAVVQVARNEMLRAGASLDFTPPVEWNEGDTTVVVRVRVVKGSGATVGLGTAQGTWNVRFNGEEWVVKSDREIEYVAEAQRGDWTTIKFVVRGISQGNERGERLCAIFVDGSRLMDDGSLNGEFEHFTVWAGDSTVMVGGAEVVRQ